MDPHERIKSLSDNGNAVEVDENIPIKRYFRSGMEMVKMAAIYEQEENFESAFILYIRFITLFVEKLRTHPDYHDYTALDKKTINRKLNDVFPRAEHIKDRLREKYYREHEKIVAQQKELEQRIRMEREREGTSKQEAGTRSASQHRNKWDNIKITSTHESFAEDNSLKNLSYPSDILSPTERENFSNGEVIGKEIASLQKPTSISQASLPHRDLKPDISSNVPSVNRSTKPLSLLCPDIDQKGKLRTVIIPEELMTRFLKLAFANTSKNIETCGILAGKMSLNRFVITHLLLPQQVGTPDSCTTQHEEELFTHQDSLDVITLGWIHTHPSQTAFLSSVDLHTHCSYQLMMPESVAIVCAPKYNETGYFTLTPNHGLLFISNCRKDGFHPHPNEPPLFETASHIQIDPTVKIDVVDLRR